MHESTSRNRVVPLDTTPEAYAAQGDLYRRMTGEQRLAISLRLSADVRRAAMAGIRARHPDYSAGDVRRAYARLILGETLAAAVWGEAERREP